MTNEHITDVDFKLRIVRLFDELHYNDIENIGLEQEIEIVEVEKAAIETELWEGDLPTPLTPPYRRRTTFMVIREGFSYPKKLVEIIHKHNFEIGIIVNHGYPKGVWLELISK